MAFGQSGFGSREEREDPAGGLKSFAGAKGAPSAPRNEGRELTQELATTAAGTAMKEGAGGKLLGSLKTLGGTLGSAASGGAGLASKMAGSLGPQGAASLLPQVAPTAISSAMGGVGAAALPFAGPLALAALPFLFNEGTESVGGNTMETDDVNEIANNYAAIMGGSPRVMPRPVMGGAPFMDRPADVDTAGGVQPFMAATPNLGKSSESQLLNKFYSPGMGYGLAGIGEGLFDSAYMRKAPPVVNQVPSMENVSGRDVSTEFPGVYTAPRAPVNVEMTTPSYREVNPLDYHMRQWYGIPNIMKGVDAFKSIWDTPAANESNHAYYKGGTHKVAGIDPQKYARGEDDVGLYEDMYPGNFGLTDFGKEEWVPSPGMGDGFSEWGVDSIFDKNYFDPRDYSRANTMGPQMAGGWTKWHENKYEELFDLYEQTERPDVLRDLQELSRESRFYQGFHLPGVPLKYNSGTSSVGNFSGGPLSDRDMKIQAHQQKLRHNEEKHAKTLSST